MIDDKSHVLTTAIIAAMVGKLGALALVCVMTVAGCSVAGILAGSATFEPPKNPSCHGYAPPVIDTIVAAPPLAVAVAGLTCENDDEYDGTTGCEMARAATPTALAVVVVFAAAATLGYVRSSRCTDAKHEYRAWRKSNPDAKPPARPAPRSPAIELFGR